MSHDLGLGRPGIWVRIWGSCKNYGLKMFGLISSPMRGAMSGESAIPVFCSEASSGQKGYSLYVSVLPKGTRFQFQLRFLDHMEDQLRWAGLISNVGPPPFSPPNALRDL